MQAQMEQLGYKNVFIGTVEGEPEDTSCESVIAKVKDAGYKNVILRPLMVVAGDHANNDMAGDDDDSWKSQFEASKNFDSVKTQIAGLGEIDAIPAVICCSYKSSYGCTVRKIIKGDNNVEKEIDGSCTVCSNDSCNIHRMCK